MHRALSTLRRVVIEAVDPEVDGGKFPIKRCLGDRVRMQADIFADGHDLLGARLLFRRADDSEWRGAGLRVVGDYRWGGGFEGGGFGRNGLTSIGWGEAYGTWGAGPAQGGEAGAAKSAGAARG